MNLKIISKSTNIDLQEFEIVERKGKGHPDTLADRLAENLSIRYSEHTRERFGIILRHQFDKLTLMGGKSEVEFGRGKMVSPVRLLLNGRVSKEMGNKTIDFRDMLFGECENFLNAELKNFDFSLNCRVLFETTSNSTRGLIDNSGNNSISYRFSPRTINDLPESSMPLANDTAMGCAFAPLSSLEQLVTEIENHLSLEAVNKYPWIGTDIKIMAYRVKNDVHITLAVPQICTDINSTAEYFDNIQTLNQIVGEITTKYEWMNVKFEINPSDNSSKGILYLRLTGSCIESGDEGMVGRGNRIGGIISSCRPFSIEGLNGKNPAYHAGKLYSVAAWDIANLIWMNFHVPCEVFIISQIDRPLNDPWKVIINCASRIDEEAANVLATGVLSNISTLTDKILNRQYPLC